ncbi:LOW QUALITY PROTEIN: collagen alpha-1(I) chain-like [Antechinus flavipes]|uniref:LOW QUALITY PROTEIN: collagen alpha-1(I) chain-like n=1 Tax=Antechinus flavipes TaxID=38775 RepID=UPI00223594E3|nr:LOW QUALITY PROTEIN: collagen alpha-1(I) chain-like [Antechinus flavipes]
MRCAPGERRPPFAAALRPPARTALRTGPRPPRPPRRSEGRGRGGPAIRGPPRLLGAAVYRPSQTPHLTLSPERVAPGAPRGRALGARSESPSGLAPPPHRAPAEAGRRGHRGPGGHPGGKGRRRSRGRGGPGARGPAPPRRHPAPRREGGRGRGATRAPGETPPRPAGRAGPPPGSPGPAATPAAAGAIHGKGPARVQSRRRRRPPDPGHPPAPGPRTPAAPTGPRRAKPRDLEPPGADPLPPSTAAVGGGRRGVVGRGEPGEPRGRGPGGERAGGPRGGGRREDAGRGSGGASSSRGARPAPLRAPARPTQPLEPILIPKLRIRLADFPYLHCSNMPEAVHLGDLLRIWVRPGARFTPSPPDFQGPARAHRTPPEPRRFPRRGPLSRGEPIPGRPALHKEKRTLPGAPAGFSGIGRVTALDASRRPSPPLRIRGSEPDSLSIGRGSRLNICYYHQDLHPRRLHPGPRPRLPGPPRRPSYSSRPNPATWNPLAPIPSRPPPPRWGGWERSEGGREGGENPNPPRAPPVPPRPPPPRLGRRGVVGRGEPGEPRGRGPGGERAGGPRGGGRREDAGRGSGGASSSRGARPAPLRAPARPTQPLEPILIPKLRIRLADFPYLHCSNMPEAVHLGDLLRIWVRPGARFTPSPPDFQGPARAHRTPPEPRRFPRRGPLSRGEPIPGRPALHKEKRTLPGAPAGFSGIGRVTALDASRRPSPPLRIRGSEPDSLSIGRGQRRPSPVPSERRSPISQDRLTHVQLLFTWNPSPLRPSKFSFEYLLLPPRSAPAAAPPGPTP